MRRFGPFLLALFAPAACLWLAAQAPTHIVIAHTNDIHGQLLPKDGFGGIAEVAAAILIGKPPRVRPAAEPGMARLRGTVALVLQKHFAPSQRSSDKEIFVEPGRSADLAI